MVRSALAIVGVSAILTAGAARAADGAQLYSMQCRMCHQTAGSALAPSLIGVTGSKMAAKDFAYSAALKAKGETWTDANLDSFLKGPPAFVPGTRMIGVSVPSDENRAALIAYLHTLK